MTTTFEAVKVGDRVWDIGKGWGTVQEVLCESRWPVQVRFDTSYQDSYTYAGGITEPAPRTLFWDELVIPIKPLPKLKVDTLVRVWDRSRDHAKLRYFSHFEGTKIFTYGWGATSITADATSAWVNWEVVAV